MTVRLMYDSVTPGDIPLSVNPQIVAGYLDGHYQSFNGLVQRFPNAVHIPIAVFPSTNAGQILDCETGDATPAQCPAWIKMRKAAGLYRPTIYTLASWVGEVKSICATAGLVLNVDWDLIIAHYDGRAVSDGYGEIGKQFIDHGPSGENYDISAIFDDGWPHITPTPNPTHNNNDDDIQEDQPMIAIKPGERLFVCVPPANSGGAGWKDVWGSIGVDNYDNPGNPVRVVVKAATGDPHTGWYGPDGTDASTMVNLQNGRSYWWKFKTGDEGVSLWNQGKETITFLVETGPR